MINEHDIKDWEMIDIKAIDAEMQEDGNGLLSLQLVIPPEMFNLPLIEVLAIFIGQDGYDGE